MDSTHGTPKEDIYRIMSDLMKDDIVCYESMYNVDGSARWRKFKGGTENDHSSPFCHYSNRI